MEFAERNVQLAEIEEPMRESLPDDRIDLHNALLKLPGDYRIVIHMYYFEGYKTKEISQILKVNEASVRTKLARGRNRLKKILKEEWADETGYRL